MIRVGTPERGASLRTQNTLQGLRARGTAWKHYILLPEDEPPQAYIAEQAPESIHGVHFHGENQYQVVVAGSGKLGGHHVRPLMVQYASRHMPYGPICADSEGLTYVTLRAAKDSGANYMPQSRHLMSQGQKCQLLSQEIALPNEWERDRQQPKIRELFALRDDGVAAWILQLPADHALPCPAVKPHGGLHILVVGGSMHFKGEEISRLGCVFSSNEEDSIQIMASSRGLDALVMQYPAK